MRLSQHFCWKAADLALLVSGSSRQRRALLVRMDPSAGLVSELRAEGKGRSRYSDRVEGSSGRELSAQPPLY